MHPLIDNVQITYNKSDGTVEIVISSEDVSQEAKVSVTKTGTFRFSINHPEDGKKHSYKGIMNSKRTDAILYPIIGDAVISQNPIPINEK